MKNAVNFIGEYENTLAAEARRRGVDGVICGHIHHAVIRQDVGLSYINCGDWVESCTAAIEHFDGRFEIVRWIGRGPRLDEPQPATAAVPRAAQPRTEWQPAACGLAATLARLAGRRSELRAPPAAE